MGLRKALRKLDSSARKAMSGLDAARRGNVAGAASKLTAAATEAHGAAKEGAKLAAKTNPNELRARLARDMFENIRRQMNDGPKLS